MPCLARCRTGRHVCAMADGHPGAHAAPGHIWDTPSPPTKGAVVSRDRDGVWAVDIYDPSHKNQGRDRPIRSRSIGNRWAHFPTHAAALAHALAAVGLTPTNPEKEQNR